MTDKNESSVAAGITGAQGPGSAMIKRIRNPWEEQSFEELVAFCEVHNKDIGETVKKRGEQWVVFDDKTGVEKGVYPHRTDAWKKQRQLRQQTKFNKKKSKKKKHGSTFEKTPKTKKADLAPKAATAPKAHLAPKPKKEHLMLMFKESLKRVLMNEGSALSYVFEQSPLPNDSLAWEQFLQKLSKQTLLSDPKLRSILQNMAKFEVKLLANSVKAIKEVLEATGTFEVEQKKADQDAAGDLFLPFEVALLQNKKKMSFAVKIEHGRPLLQFPEQTKAELNMLANDESKLLRSELVHAQETILDEMSEVVDSTAKRDEYLIKTQVEVDKVLKNMPPLQISMMRYLLKSKYKGIK